MSDVGARRAIRGIVELVRAAYPGYHGPRPRMQLWHGTADTILSHESSQALYDRALEPKTLRLFPAVGHLLNEVSDEVFVDVSQWLMAHA